LASLRPKTQQIRIPSPFLCPSSGSRDNSLGDIKSDKNDFAGAGKDYSQAIELNPKNAKAYNGRGYGKQVQGDLDGAIADYNLAIQINDQSPLFHMNRGNARQAKGDLSGAIADFTRVMELDPKSVYACFNRGVCYYQSQNWTNALADLQYRCRLNANGGDFPRLYVWVLRTRLNQRVPADQELADYLDRRQSGPPDAWFEKVADHVLGKIGESVLFAGADSTDAETKKSQLGDAYYFAGMKRLFAGEEAVAADYFHKCLAAEDRTYVEYLFASTELQRIRK